MKKSKLNTLKLSLGLFIPALTIPSILTSCTWSYKEGEKPGFSWEDIDSYATVAHAHPMPADGSDKWTIPYNYVDKIYTFMNEAFTDQVLYDSMVYYVYAMGQMLLEGAGDRGTLKYANFKVYDEGSTKVCHLDYAAEIAGEVWSEEVTHNFTSKNNYKFYYDSGTWIIAGEKEEFNKLTVEKMVDPNSSGAGFPVPSYGIDYVLGEEGSGVQDCDWMIPYYDFLMDDGKTSRIDVTGTP